MVCGNIVHDHACDFLAKAESECQALSAQHGPNKVMKLRTNQFRSFMSLVHMEYDPEMEVVLHRAVGGQAVSGETVTRFVSSRFIGTRNTDIISLFAMMPDETFPVVQRSLICIVC